MSRALFSLIAAARDALDTLALHVDGLTAHDAPESETYAFKKSNRKDARDAAAAARVALKSVVERTKDLSFEAGGIPRARFEDVRLYAEEAIECVDDVEGQIVLIRYGKVDRRAKACGFVVRAIGRVRAARDSAEGACEALDAHRRARATREGGSR